MVAIKEGGEVTPEWLDRGVSLSKAAEAFGNRGFAERHKAAAEKFASLRDGETPEMFIQTSRLSGVDRDRELRAKLADEQRLVWGEYRECQDALRRDLCFKLAWGGTLLAFGDPRHPGANPEWIPERTWFHLKIDWDEKDVARGEAITYWYVRVVDPSRFSESEGLGATEATQKSNTHSPPGVFSELALRAWYRERVYSWPKDHPAPSEETDWIAARVRFDDCPRVILRRVRRDLSPEEWRKPGPRRAKSR
jgi:hypothetical protein